MNSSIHIVLVETSHPGNIGAAARAMKNMGLSSLRLVAPARYPHADATARAAGADDVLAQAAVCAGLDEALAGCQLVIGMSARRRRLSSPVLSSRDAAARVVNVTAAGGDVAVLFGRENSGLTNEELDRCQFHVQIPCNPHFSSLNVAAAVQVMCYEMMLADVPSGPGSEVPGSPTLATADEVEGYYDHLQEVMIQTEFLNPEQPGILMRRLRRLYNRVQLEHEEIQILRGILTSVQKFRGKWLV